MICQSGCLFQAHRTGEDQEGLIWPEESLVEVLDLVPLGPRQMLGRDTDLGIGVIPEKDMVGAFLGEKIGLRALREDVALPARPDLLKLFVRKRWSKDQVG